MSFKAEVIADNSGAWCSNALRFATQSEAWEYGNALSMRWTAVRQMRAVSAGDDPVNARYRDGRLEHLTGAKT